MIISHSLKNSVPLEVIRDSLEELARLENKARVSGYGNKFYRVAFRDIVHVNYLEADLLPRSNEKRRNRNKVNCCPYVTQKALLSWKSMNKCWSGDGIHAEHIVPFKYTIDKICEKSDDHLDKEFLMSILRNCLQSLCFYSKGTGKAREAQQDQILSENNGAVTTQIDEEGKEAYTRRLLSKNGDITYLFPNPVFIPPEGIPWLPDIPDMRIGANGTSVVKKWDDLESQELLEFCQEQSTKVRAHIESIGAA